MRVVDRDTLIELIVNKKDFSNVDTSKVEIMRYMFRESKIKVLPKNFNFSNVTDIIHMFLKSELSEKGYNELLINLSNQRLNPGLELNVESLELKIISKKALLSKERLINKYKWRIIDDGENIPKRIYKDINKTNQLSDQKIDNIDILNLF